MLYDFFFLLSFFPSIHRYRDIIFNVYCICTIHHQAINSSRLIFLAIFPKRYETNVAYLSIRVTKNVLFFPKNLRGILGWKYLGGCIFFFSLDSSWIRLPVFRWKSARNKDADERFCFLCCIWPVVVDD